MDVNIHLSLLKYPHTLDDNDSFDILSYWQNRHKTQDFADFSIEKDKYDQLLSAWNVLIAVFAMGFSSVYSFYSSYMTW